MTLKTITKIPYSIVQIQALYRHGFLSVIEFHQKLEEYYNKRSKNA